MLTTKKLACWTVRIAGPNGSRNYIQFGENRIRAPLTPDTTSPVVRHADDLRSQDRAGELGPGAVSATLSNGSSSKMSHRLMSRRLTVPVDSLRLSNNRLGTVVARMGLIRLERLVDTGRHRSLVRSRIQC